MKRMHEARLGLGLLAVVGVVSVLAGRGLGAQTPSSSSSPVVPQAAASAAHGAHGVPQAAAPADRVSCRRFTPPTSEPIRTRHNVKTGGAFLITAMKKGVDVMKSRPETDPTSWLYQANIHGVTDSRTLPSWKTCQHGNYLFLSWHRMYLYFFERILRKASGTDITELLYWNYSDPTQRALPSAFRSPANSGQNSLYLEQRAPGINDGAELPGSATDYSTAFSYIPFTSPAGSSASFGGNKVEQPTHFGSPGGQLERLPHNAIHNLVGGSDGWMADANLAARDPIFWAHHANIDRLWSKWMALGGGRENPPSSDTVWNSTEFTFFDENGQCVVMTGADVVNAAQQLRYRYDDEAKAESRMTRALSTNGHGAATNGHAQRVLAEAAAAGVQLSGARQTVPVVIKEEQRAAVLAMAQAAPAADEKVTLILDDVDYENGAYYEVYLNLPESVAKPLPGSPYYVGVFSPFAMKGHGDEQGPSITLDYDVTKVVSALTTKKLWKGEAMQVTFVPVTLKRPGAATTAVPQTSSKARFGKVQVVSSK